MVCHCQPRASQGSPHLSQQALHGARAVEAGRKQGLALQRVRDALPY